jgi:hypothetical protein
LDPLKEVEQLRARLAELDVRARLGREPIRGSGPGGRLEAIDLQGPTRVRLAPDEYELRRDEVFSALEGHKRALPVDSAGRTLPLTPARIRTLTRDQVEANLDAVHEAIEHPPEATQ